MNVHDATTSAGLDLFLAGQRNRTAAILHAIAAELDVGAGVAAAMAYALRGDGKRLRPALCVACFRAAGGSNDDAVQRLAAALEIIHTYSLVHDDLPCMDNDDFRRGRQTVHRVYGQAAATLAGAALIPLAFRIAADALQDLRLDYDMMRRALQLLARSAGADGMVGGQLLDLEGGARITSVVELEGIHAAKTGALISAACLVGALAADASDALLHAFGEYGRHLGLAFQITDDVLDETASTAQLGKTAGKDRDGAKATYPALLGLEMARQRARGEARLATRALRAAGVEDVLLQELAAFAIERRR
ncbi:MAG TPA: farnesyl diphosphate synthase [Longimicrobiales bacterium]